MLDFVTVGHITLDCIRRGRPERLTWVPGGPAVHTSLIVASLGTKTYALSKVGADFGRSRIRWIAQTGVDTRLLKMSSTPTTKFEIRYWKEKRSLRLVSKCEAINRFDLPQGLRIRSLHLGPVIDEIPEVVARSLASRSIVTSLDPQGYLRRVAGGGRVVARSWLDKALLRRIDVLRGSSDELRMMVGRISSKDALRRLRGLGPSVCVLTRSGNWSDLICDDGIFRIPAFKPETVVDPTGAGDAFSGAFLTEYVQSNEPVWSACVGAAAASLKVETSGPCFIRDRSKLMERANILRSGVLRLG